MSDPVIDPQNFEAWFGVPLTNLMADRNAGFIVAMTAFCLLERYLRQRTRSEPNTAHFNEDC
jgi:hypothetical protein